MPVGCSKAAASTAPIGKTAEPSSNSSSQPLKIDRPSESLPFKFLFRTVSGEYWPSPTLQEYAVYRLIKKIGEGQPDLWFWKLCIAETGQGASLGFGTRFHLLIAPLATGAFADVYLAEHLQTAERVGPS